MTFLRIYLTFKMSLSSGPCYSCHFNASWFQTFNVDLEKFEEKMKDIDRKLASIIGHGFADLNSVEAIFKVGKISLRNFTFGIKLVMLKLLREPVTNKTRTSKVCAISQAQKAQNFFLERNLKFFFLSENVA